MGWSIRVLFQVAELGVLGASFTQSNASHPSKESVTRSIGSCIPCVLINCITSRKIVLDVFVLLPPKIKKKLN